MRIAALQHDIVWEDAAATCARLVPMIAEAAADGAGLIVLTEMFGPGFSLAADRISEPPGGPTEQFLVDRAASNGVWIGGSIPTRDRDDAHPVNRFLLVGPDGTRHHYDKLHPFTFADEHEHYRAGDEPVTVDIGGLRVSLFVCYDLRFANAFWERATGTDVYLVVANWPAARRYHWRTLLRARAIENQAYVVGVNRVGTDPKLSYTGDSVIVDPFGEVLAEAEPGCEEVLVAEVDPARVAEVRARYPFLQDRRG